MMAENALEKNIDIEMEQTTHSEPLQIIASTCGDSMEVDGGIENKKYYELHQACEKGELDTVKRMLDSESNVDATTAAGFTPLICASLHGHLEVVKLLLARGAQIDFATPVIQHDAPRYAALVHSLLEEGDARAYMDIQDLGFTALDAASQHGHLEIVKLLLDQGGSIFDLKTDFKPLFVASQNGHLEVVRLLLDRGASIDLVNDGFTSLNVAAKSGHLEVVRLLLERGAAVDFTPLGFSSLYFACCNGHLEVARLLLDQGADIEFAENADKNTPLLCAAVNGHVHVVKLLFERGVNVDQAEANGNTALYVASALGHVAVVQLLVDKGANVDASNSKGFTALYRSAGSGHTETVKVLVDNGATIDQADNEGFSPLYFAAQEGYLNVVKVLLDSGASIVHEGNSAIHHAAEKGHHDVVKEMLDRGTSVELVVEGVTSLHFAAKYGKIEVVKLLIARGAEINVAATEGNGSTPLINAACNGHVAVVELLLDHGARVDMCTRQGVTPLCVASRYGYLEVVKLLLKRGADVCLSDYDDFSPVHEAARNGRVDVLIFLLEQGANIHAVTKNSRSTALLEAACEQKFDVLQFLAPKSADLDERGCRTALTKCFKADRLDICETMLQARPELATEERTAIHLATQSTSPKSLPIMKFLIEKGAQVNVVDNSSVEDKICQTPLHIAIKTKQPEKVWLLIMNGAAMSNVHLELGGDSKLAKTVWKVCQVWGDKETYAALLHFWAPQTHKYHPPWVKDAALSVLLVARRQEWPFDKSLLFKIISHVAYDWLKL